LPQVAEQSLSVLWVQPAGQQPSPLLQLVMFWYEQAAVHDAAEPVSVSTVQALPSLHELGQLPSQVSPASTSLSPQKPVQSVSLAWVQPAGQQPSPPMQVVIDWNEQATEQLPAEPVKESMVQALPSLQAVGQLPSQVSPGSMTALPQEAEQSVSLLWLQPGGQQPSPDWHWLTGPCVQETEQLPAEPVLVSVVQALPSLQSTAQLPSQVSEPSTIPLPHVAEQSLSRL